MNRIRRRVLPIESDDSDNEHSKRRKFYDSRLPNDCVPEQISDVNRRDSACSGEVVQTRSRKRRVQILNSSSSKDSSSSDDNIRFRRQNKITKLPSSNSSSDGTQVERSRTNQVPSNYRETNSNLSESDDSAISRVRLRYRRRITDDDQHRHNYNRRRSLHHRSRTNSSRTTTTDDSDSGDNSIEERELYRHSRRSYRRRRIANDNQDRYNNDTSRTLYNNSNTNNNRSVRIYDGSESSDSSISQTEVHNHLRENEGRRRRTGDNQETHNNLRTRPALRPRSYNSRPHRINEDSESSDDSVGSTNTYYHSAENYRNGRAIGNNNQVRYNNNRRRSSLNSRTNIIRPPPLIYEDYNSLHTSFGPWNYQHHSRENRRLVPDYANQTGVNNTRPRYFLRSREHNTRNTVTNGTENSYNYTRRQDPGNHSRGSLRSRILTNGNNLSTYEDVSDSSSDYSSSNSSLHHLRVNNNRTRRNNNRTRRRIGGSRGDSRENTIRPISLHQTTHNSRDTISYGESGNYNRASTSTNNSRERRSIRVENNHERGTNNRQLPLLNPVAYNTRANRTFGGYETGGYHIAPQNIMGHWRRGVTSQSNIHLVGDSNRPLSSYSATANNSEIGTTYEYSRNVTRPRSSDNHRGTSLSQPMTAVGNLDRSAAHDSNPNNSVQLTSLRIHIPLESDYIRPSSILHNRRTTGDINGTTDYNVRNTLNIHPSRASNNRTELPHEYGPDVGPTTYHHHLSIENNPSRGLTYLNIAEVNPNVRPRSLQVLREQEGRGTLSYENISSTSESRDDDISPPGVDNHASTRSPADNYSRLNRPRHNNGSRTINQSDSGSSENIRPRLLQPRSRVLIQSNSSSDTEDERPLNRPKRLATRKIIDSDDCGAKNNDTKSSSDTEQKYECPICLDNIHAKEIGKPSVCNHKFCLGCIQEWAKNNNTCPVDRKRFMYIELLSSFDGIPIREIAVPNVWGDDIFFHLEDVSSSETSTDDNAVDIDRCCVCRRNENNGDNAMIYCDRCYLIYHLECVYPPLHVIPAIPWFCRNCEII